MVLVKEDTPSLCRPPRSLLARMDDLFGTQDSQHTADPASDFLARERELLGADAGQFANPTAAASLDKDYEQSAAAFPDLDDAGDDALGSFTGGPAQASGGAPAQVGHQVSVTGDNEFAAFEQEYPEIELPSEEVRTRYRRCGLSGPRRLTIASSPLSAPPPQPPLSNHHAPQPHQNGLNGTAPAPSPIGLAAPAFNQSAPATPAPQDEGESEFIKSVARLSPARFLPLREERAH